MSTATVGKHNPIPYSKIAKLYEEGKSYMVIAQKVDRFNEKAPDPTKSVRAIVSRMITEGFTNAEGKTVKLKKRAGSRGGKKLGKHVTVKAKVKMTSKAIAIIVTSDGKHIRLKVPSLETLIPIDTFKTKVEKALTLATEASAEPVPTQEVAAPAIENVEVAAPAIENVEVAEMTEVDPSETVEQPAPELSENEQAAAA